MRGVGSGGGTTTAVRADGPEDPSTDQNADRSRGYERTNTNSAFYPFRGGMTHVSTVHRRIGDRLPIFWFIMTASGYWGSEYRNRKRPTEPGHAPRAVEP